MEFGIALPNGIPGRPLGLLPEWSMDAEAAGFAVLGATDRFGFGATEPLVALAAAAAVTKQIRLASTVLMAPLRQQPALGEQLLSLHGLAGPRFHLGVGLGGRREDYANSSVPWNQRGRCLDEQLTWLREHPTLRGLTILVGGHSERAFERTAAYGSGFISSGGSARSLTRQFELAETSWVAAGRPGRPLRWATAYFALDNGAAAGRHFLSDYYADAGAYRDAVVSALLTDKSSVEKLVGSYRNAGCDMLVFLPAVADRRQVFALAEVLPSSRHGDGG